MLDLYDELRAITRALDAAGVPYALIGGIAVSMPMVFADGRVQIHLKRLRGSPQDLADLAALGPDEETTG